MTDGGITVMRFESGHAAEAAQIERMCFSDPWSDNEFKAIAVGGCGERCIPVFFSAVSVSDGKLAGFIGMYHVLDEGQIVNVAVHPDFRRRGVASVLLEAVFGYASENKLATLTLEVRKSNDAARRLYEKYGFDYVGTRPRFYSRPTEDALLMTSLLKKAGRKLLN